jgi:2-keto-3-deoxy-L-rhamnonate aldolase RhmA
LYNYLFITNKPAVARYVEQSGVTRIFVDLEILGKEKRQGHLDTVISRHEMEDIGKIKAVLNKAELLVRLNPLHELSQYEIDKAIELGADILMQPMFHSADEVERFGQLINGRAKFIPLVETVKAAQHINEIEQLQCVDEIHIGLNDLHLELGLGFMFELISNGMVDRMVKSLIKPFGIGGIARVGSGKVPGEMVMAEHVRLGSSGVILSRDFNSGSSTLEDLNYQLDFSNELQLLDEQRISLLEKNIDDKVNEKFKSIVDSIVRGKS